MALTCAKTGRYWPVNDQAHADRLARELGLTDYEVR